MATKAQLEAELAHYKKLDRMVKWTVLFLWAIALTILLTYNYKVQLIEEQKAQQYLDQSLGDWHTEVYPEPQPMFTWPRTPIIDAFNFITGSTAAVAAPHDPRSDLPTQHRHLFPSPLKLWSIEQLSDDRNHLACSATRSMSNGVVVSVTAYKNGTVELFIDRASFYLNPERPYADAIISVDNATFVQTVAKRVNDYQTSLDITSLSLTQLANGKILRVTINGYYFEFDLTGSANAAKYVNACNVQGQSLVHERIVAAAQPAVVLETTQTEN